jgi:tetratricopeptide (TPR) repeat protein
VPAKGEATDNAPDTDNASTTAANPNHNNPNSCISEGDILLKRGEFRRAAEAYTLALQFRAEDKLALCSRSKAYLLMGLSKPSLTDAEQVLALCGLHESYFEALATKRVGSPSDQPSATASSPLGTKAIHLKAEALYSMGLFEEALMWFHRGRQRCLAKAGVSTPGGETAPPTDNAQMSEFRMGITKAEEAIRNALSLGARGEPPKQHHQTHSPTKPSKNPSTTSPVSPTSPQNDAAILGPLAQDLLYLRQMSTDPLLSFSTKVHALALEGAEYLENRAAFWRSQRGLDRPMIGAAAGQVGKVTFEAQGEVGKTAGRAKSNNKLDRGGVVGTVEGASRVVEGNSKRSGKGGRS